MVRAQPTEDVLCNLMPSDAKSVVDVVLNKGHIDTLSNVVSIDTIGWIKTSREETHGDEDGKGVILQISGDRQVRRVLQDVSGLYRCSLESQTISASQGVSSWIHDREYVSK